MSASKRTCRRRLAARSSGRGAPAQKSPWWTRTRSAAASRAREELNVRRDPRDDRFDGLAAGHLKSVRPVVVVGGGVENRIEVLDDRLKRRHASQPGL